MKDIQQKRTPLSLYPWKLMVLPGRAWAHTPRRGLNLEKLKRPQVGVSTPPRKDKLSNKHQKKISSLQNRETPSTPLRRAPAHSLSSKKNEADPDSQEMRTGAGNHEEALRAKNSYLECAYQAGG